jgi:hypothetical protein
MTVHCVRTTNFCPRIRSFSENNKKVINDFALETLNYFENNSSSLFFFLFSYLSTETVFSFYLLLPGHILIVQAPTCSSRLRSHEEVADRSSFVPS